MGPQGIQGAPGANGLVQSVNGKSAADISLTAADVGALPAAGKIPLANLPEEWTPADHGLTTWAYDPGISFSTGRYSGSGTVRVTAVAIHQPCTISKIVWHYCGYAGGLQAGSWAAVYDANGNLVAQAADIAGANKPPVVSTSGGTTVFVPLTSPWTAPSGTYFVVWRYLYNASTNDGPMMLQLENGGAAPPNFFGLSTVRRFGSYATIGATSPPSSISIAAMENGSNRFWAALA
ncbi:hypothetical protein [Kitasatospora sp. NPDC059800]|uniref:hypothetical protein n=1 Tax=Kitasatospora sp. NPDC059800 TaxID=3346951 RepID=UPI00365D8405